MTRVQPETDTAAQPRAPILALVMHLSVPRTAPSWCLTRRSGVRARSVAIVSMLVAVSLLASGCTTDAAIGASADLAPSVDLCAIAAPSGAASDAIVVEGAVGSPASVTLPVPLSITGTERTVIVEGSGEQIDGRSLIDYAATVFDATTGAELRSEGYAETPVLPVAAGAIGAFVGCATVGSRLAIAVPATDNEGATVWVLDVLDSMPAAATGEQQKPVDGMPAVRLGEGGSPMITIPGHGAPTETAVAVLKKGDGTVVGVGDTVLVQYTGVRWSDGTVFDSSWSKGAPTTLATTQVIPGYKTALEGQTVGSQVLAVIPPRFAYGEGQINETDLAGETLVFVIDILGTTPPTP